MREGLLVLLDLAHAKLSNFILGDNMYTKDEVEIEDVVEEETVVVTEESPSSENDPTDEIARPSSKNEDGKTILASIDQVTTKIEVLQSDLTQQLAVLRDQANLAQTLHADMQKYRDDYWFKQFMSRLVNDLLRIHDKFVQTLKPENIKGMSHEALIRRIERFDKELLKALDRQNVIRIPVELEKPFNDRIQEAIDTQPMSDNGAVEQVVAVVEDGFFYGNQLLRPQKVIVSA